MILGSVLLVPACGGKSGGGKSNAFLFNVRSTDLYLEVPLITIEGNNGLNFNPKTPMNSETYDADGDGIDDTLINDFNSMVNAANRLLDFDLASCASTTSTDPLNYIKHEGYLQPAVWTDATEFPDTMPATAAGTGGTQFIQLVLPFPVNAGSIISASNLPADDYLNPTSLTIEDELGNHVPCTVLVNGLDINGNGPDNSTDYSDNWDELVGALANPGAGKTSIIFIAQPSTGLLSAPSMQAFVYTDEIRISLIQVVESGGTLINTDSRWVVVKTGATLIPPVFLGIEATQTVTDNTGSPVLDWDDPTQTGPGDPKTVELVERGTEFILRFDKPVIPETVGQSIVFGGSPFNGNIRPLPTNLILHPPPTYPHPGNPCANSGTYRDPLGTNVGIISTIYYGTGSASNIKGCMPFRVTPLHQNNLCTYILNPIVDLPGSSDLGNPPLQDPTVTDFTRMRMTVKVYKHDENFLTATPYEPLPAVNMGITGYQGLAGELVDTESTKTFTVNSGGRYVNAPVSPHAMYFTMGPKGLGVVDLDGNGFTTNAPSFSKKILVTSEKFFNRYGNAGLGVGNTYSYAAKATIDPNTGSSSYIGLGLNTPMPGINEGSSGTDEVVRDSNGFAQLYPDPLGDENFYNITDVVVGDFLDTIYYDRANVASVASLHQSPILQPASPPYPNNLISAPPTPNPPPLSIPVAMRPVEVILDEYSILEEGAFVIMTKEVFTVDVVTLTNGMGITPNVGFINLEPAEIANSPTDETFPPNRSIWGGNIMVDYLNLGPVAESSTTGFALPYGSRQQIGNFLFVVDKSNNQVRVVNSNTMETITRLTSGLSQPDSAVITTDLKNLYVSNSGGQSVTVFNVDPRTEGFLSHRANIFVGSQPKGLCCQPDQEDIMVCNFGSNTMSLINPKTNTVRKTLSSLLNGPWDVVAGPRQIQFGFGTQVYHAYITNYKADSVLIYESGPSGLGGVGYDDILDPIPDTGMGGQQFDKIEGPRGICWDPTAGLQYPLSGGVYIAHRSGSYGMISRVEFTAQQAPWGPIFLIPNQGSIGGTPGFGKRIFVITAQWGGSKNPLSGTAATDVALLDFRRQSWENDNWVGNFDVTNKGDLTGPLNFLPINNKNPLRQIGGAYVQVNNPDRMYICYQYQPVIDIIDLSGSTIVKTITGLPSGANSLKSYFKY